MSEQERDPNIGKVFEDRDSRMVGRRIRVLKAVTKTNSWGNKYPAYQVVTVISPAYESAIGNKSSVSVKNLAKRFREVVL